jgi:hypothetical protein
MPATEFYTGADTVAFYFLSAGGWLLQWVFVSGILLGLEGWFHRLISICAMDFVHVKDSGRMPVKVILLSFP